MKYLVLLEKLNPFIEEEVTIYTNDITLTGFSSVCPYPIEVGKHYKVELGLTILDEIKIKKLEKPIEELYQISDGLAYLIRGKLTGNKLNAGVLFEEDFLFEYSHLDGEYIELYVDRISVEFL
ncbi:hypothetical protein K0T92_03880 [Paenibacillus oenotherae]|uniref:Uncharacterized protein n=1 Tax=Paenibacillus oenotherae TaxID=1435645 RepID=A0ABS7D3V9_9BACL|nr:hypothetical protein [Paenibacillus oenotherae]MBW7473873.1 hypothetical protein [Paenibacillus oenotherae]